jgi:hypothetical protein
MDRWTCFRLRVRFLAVVDWMLGTHLVERLTDHWRQEIQLMQSDISSLHTRLEELDDSRSAMLRQLCANYLQIRQIRSPEDWLHFDPRNPDEESAIEVLTRALVAPHSARWHVNPLAGHDNLYTYDLVPDWEALYQDAVQHADVFSPSLLNWLAEHSRRKEA